MSKLFYQEPHIYHAEPRLSKSGLDRLNQSPAHYQAWLNRDEDTPTPSQVFGAAYHCKALEPHLYPALYAVIPQDAPRRNGKGKEWWEIFDKNNEGKTYLKQKDEETILAMVNVLRNHSRVKRLLEGALIEYSCYTTLFGVDVKCKPDILRPDLRLAADLKSCRAADRASVQRDVANYRYHVQAGFYLDQLNTIERYDSFLFIFQEKTEPFAVKIYEAGEDLIHYGRQEYIENVYLYKHCIKMDEWPAYDEPIEKINMPYWYGRGER